VFSGVAKLANLARSAEAMAALGVPSPQRTAVVVAGFEILDAITLVVAPQPGAWVALLLLGVFTLFLAGRLLTGRRGECPCFGGATQITWWRVARNGGLMALAGLVLVTLR